MDARQEQVQKVAAVLIMNDVLQGDDEKKTRGKMREAQKVHLQTLSKNFG